MVIQIALGSMVILVTVLIAGIMSWGLELMLAQGHGWLTQHPHRPKLALVLSATVLWALATMTVGVWIWALVYVGLGVFPTLEQAVYFSLVAFTTLGFGDLLLPQAWQLLGGMEAVNGLLNMGLMTAMLVEVLRHVRLSRDLEPARAGAVVTGGGVSRWRSSATGWARSVSRIDT